MKRLHFIFLIYTSFGFAQLPVTSTTSLANADNDVNFGSNGNYAQDTANERQQYVGTWEYNQNGILFQVKIEKKDQYLSKWKSNAVSVIQYNYCDVVFFTYKLVVNGTTINNNLNQTVFPEIYVSQAIKKGSSDDLYGIFLDATNNVASAVTIRRLNTSPPKITFNLSPGAYFLLNPEDNPNQPLFTVPTGEIEMIKIN